MSYMKLLKPTIAYIQANIKFVKTGKHRYIKYEHINVIGTNIKTSNLSVKYIPLTVIHN